MFGLNKKLQCIFESIDFYFMWQSDKDHEARKIHRIFVAPLLENQLSVAM